MNQAGFVVIALAGLWIAYLVPHRLRYRQQLLESRTDDRFSEGLRVLRVARSTASDNRVERHDVGRSGGRLHVQRPSAQQGQSPGTGAGRGGGTMERPHATRDRVVADAARRSAAEHAARAAYLARRAAGARRRAVLTAVLLLSVVGGWTAVGVGDAAVALGASPTVALVAVLGLGRRAVVAGQRADAAWAAGAAERMPVTATGAPRVATVVGRAVHPSDATTEVFARVPRPDRESAGPTESTGPAASGDRAAPAVAERTAVDGSQGSSWAPVPVPRPAYTLKPAARRPEPAPLVLDEPVRAEAAAEAANGSGSGAPSERPDEHTGVDRVPTTGGLSLDAILARRRAAGE